MGEGVHDTGRRRWNEGGLVTILGLFVAFASVILSGVDGNHENQCFGFPTGLTNFHTGSDALWTVGSQPLYEETNREMWRGAGIPNAPADLPYGLGAGGNFNLKMREIRPLPQNQLIGWIRLRVEWEGGSGGGTVFPEVVVVTAKGRTRNAAGEPIWITGVGEFVNDGINCISDTGDARLADDQRWTSYQIMPCGGVSAFDSQLGYGFAFVRQWGSLNDTTKFGPRFPVGDSKPLGILDINFRFTSTPCNYIDQLMFAANGVFSIKEESTSDPPNKFVQYFPVPVTNSFRMSILTPFGPPEFYPSSGALKCDVVFGGIGTIQNSWNGAINVPQGVEGGASTPECYENYMCTPKFEVKRPKDIGNHRWENRLFTGRCKIPPNATPPQNPGAGASRIDGSPNNIHQCIDPDKLLAETGLNAVTKAYFEGLTKYSAELDRIQKEIKKGCGNVLNPCPTVPPRPLTSAPKTANYTEEVERIKNRITAHGGVPFEHPPDVMFKVWDTRIIHGAVMTLLTFLVLPLNSFVTRYYKETFMDKRIMFHRIWYFLHHQLSILTLVGMYVGMSRLVNTRNTLGVSLLEIGITHRVFGWLSIALVILMMLVGGYRPMHRVARLTIIAMHFSVGNIIYLCALICWLSSIFIHGSPAAWHPYVDMSILEDAKVPGTSDTVRDVYHTGGVPEFRTWKPNLTLFISCFWILFDAGAHTLMTVMMFKSDQTVKLRRPRYFFPSPMPILNEHFRLDLPGSKSRKVVLGVYITLAFLVTIANVALIVAARPHYRTVGPMSCTTEYIEGRYFFRESINPDCIVD